MADNENSETPKTPQAKSDNFDDLEDAFFASGDADGFWETAEVEQLGENPTASAPEARANNPLDVPTEVPSEAPAEVGEPERPDGTGPLEAAPSTTASASREPADMTGDFYNPSALHPNPDLIADDETEIWTGTLDSDGEVVRASELDPAETVPAPEVAAAPTAPEAQATVTEDADGILRYTPPDSVERQWAEASAALAAAAERADKSHKGTLLRHAAQIELARVGDWERAAALFDQSLAAGVQRTDLPKGYADVIASQGRFDELRDLLVERAHRAEGAAAIEALQDAAIVERNHLKNDAGAIELLNQANDIQPAWFSLRLLRELHYRGQDWVNLVDVLAAMANLSSGPRSARCKVEEGRIREVELKDSKGAAEAYDEALRRDPSFMDAFLARARVAKGEQNHADLVSLYAAHAKQTAGPNSQFWLERAARIAGQHSDERAGALYRSAIASSDGASASIFREAAAYFDAQGDSEGIYEARTAEAKGQKGPARAATLLLIGEDSISNPDRAIAQLTEAFNADPGCIPAVELAVELMVQAGRADAAIALLDQAADCEVNRAVRSRLRFRAAEIAELSLSKASEAAKRFAQVLEESPSFPFAADAQTRCLVACGNFEAAVSLLEGRATDPKSSDRSSRLWFIAASILHHDLNRPEEANQAYEKAIDASSLQPAALDLLIASLVKSKDMDGLVGAFQRAAQILPSSEGRVSAGYAAARILNDVLNEPERAETTLQACMELSPHCVPVINLLRVISIRLGRWDTVQDLARVESNMVEAGHRDWYSIQAAQAALRGTASDSDRIVGEILDSTPDHAGALGLLEREALASGDVQRLVSVTRRVRNAIEDPAERTSLTVRMADLAAHSGDRQVASRAITRVLEASVGPRPYGAMAKMAVALEFWALAEAALHADGDTAGLARLLESTSDDHKRVASAWRAVTKAQPESVEGYNGLERSMTRMANRDGLAATHGALASNEQDTSVSNMHALLAGHLYENEDAYDLAAKHYEMAFKRSSHRGKAFDALVRLYCELGRSDALIETYKSLDEPDEIGRADALLDAGANELALKIYREGAGRPESAEQEGIVLPLLVRYEQALFQAEKWSLVLECLNRRSELTSDDNQRVLIQAKQRWLLSERMADSDAAWEFYRQLHEDRPDDAEVLENLARIAGARGETKLAIQFLDGLSNIASTAEDAARYQRRVAEVHLASAAPKEARAAYLRALDHNPSDLEALVGLKQIAQEAADWQGLVGVLTREIQLVEGDAKEECARSIASLWEEKIGDAAVAIESWRRVLDLAPGDQAALGRLVALAEAQGDWASFIDDGKAMVHYLEGEDRSNLLARMGRAAIHHLRREEEAIRFLDEASASATPSLQAAEDLEQIHAARGSWDRVVECILRRASAQGGDAAVELYGRAARTRLEQLRDRRGAAEIFDEILKLEPRNVGALEFKGDYLFQQDDLEGAVAIYETIDGLNIERDLDDFDVQMEQSLYCFRFGEALRRMGRTQAAVERYEEALKLNGSHLPSLEAIGPLYVAESRFNDASRVFRQVLQLTGGQGEPGRLAKVYALLGTVEHAQGNSEKAMRRFNKALELQPNDIDALQGYACVLYERADWNNLLTTYNNIIYHAKDRNAFVKAYLMKGFVLDSHMSLADKAGQHYEKSLSFDAANPSALLRLGELALRKDEWDRASSFAGRALAIGDNVTADLSALLNAVLAVAAKETGRVDELEQAFDGIRAATSDFATEAAKMGPSGDGLHELLRKQLHAEP